MRESIKIEKHNTIDKEQEGKPLELYFLKQVLLKPHILIVLLGCRTLYVKLHRVVVLVISPHLEGF